MQARTAAYVPAGAAPPRPRQRRVWLGALLPLLAAATPGAAAIEHVATVSQLEGSAFAYVPGVPVRRLGTGDELVANTRLVTAKDAAMTVRFTDDTELTLGASTVVNIDDYRYSAQAPAAEESAFSFKTSILTGVVRSVTGLIARYRPRNVTWSTNVGTIGVRGTHFTAEVTDSSAIVILLAQEDADKPNAIEVSNQYGSVYIDEPGYGTEIPDASSPPSPPRKMQASTSMSRVLRSVNTTRRVRIPRSPMR